MSATTAPLRRDGSAARPSRGRRHLRVVDRQPRRHTVLFLIIYLVVGAVVVMGAVSLNALAAGDAVEIRELGTRLDVDQRTYDQLIAEVASLEDPARIQRLAIEMGLVPAVRARHVQPAQELDVDQGAAPAADQVKSLIGQQP